MKELFILRHGKADWDMEHISDADRVLKEKGILASYDTSSQLKQVPDLILSSPAARALQTAIIAAKTINYPLEKLQINPALYLADVAVLRGIISQTDLVLDSLMLVGHNPGLTDLVNEYLSFTLPELPTAGCVRLVFNADQWNQIHRNNRVDESIILPRNK